MIWLISTITFKVVDSETFMGIENVYITIKKPSNKSQTLNSKSPIINIITDEKGKYEFIFSADGYKPLETYFIVDENTNLEVKVILEPTYKHNDEIINIMPDEALIRGYVYDEETLKPLSNVKIKIDNEITYTDEKGFFSIKLMTFSPYEDENSKTYKVISNRKSIIFEKQGYKTYEYKNYLIVPGITTLRIGLKQGNGYISEIYKHGIIDRLPNEYIIKDGSISSENGIYKREEIMKIKDNNQINVTDVIPLPFFDPPSSIRVGTNCSCTSCSSVSVMSLEYYVQTGLNDEWIASWNAQSLRAGALAYRAYGSWHVLNPLNSNYDICSSTCCQVWDSDQSTSTKNAAIYTSGFAISPQANSVARAEYSAENNGWDNPSDGLSCVNSCPCGDGKAGSPCAGWPCINDNICAGHGCFGHGRGMCQWGTYRWGNNGYYWDWMAIHYYSSKGWHISTPMGFLNLSASPTNLQPGQSFTIYTSIYSGTPDTHPNIMLGASLYDGQNWISNPPNDIKITVKPGTHTYQRQFQTPNNIQSKCYDLVVMIWFDIDGNNNINSPADLPIDKITNTSYICINATNLAENRIGNFSYSLKPSKIIITGEGNLSIYSLDGKVIVSEFIKGKKEYSLKKGVYIIKANRDIKSFVIP